MILNYLLVFARNFGRRKLFSFINAFGLSVAIAFSVLVYFFISDEYSFDQFHDKGDRIYRINYKTFDNRAYEAGEKDHFRYSAYLSNALGNVLVEEIPEVEKVTQLKSMGKNDILIEQNVFSHKVDLVDSTFFGMFSFGLITGTTSKIFNQTFDAVISKEVAIKLFGSAQDAIGKTLNLDQENLTSPTYIVRAVLDCPANSSIEFEILLPINSYRQYLNKSWNINSYPTFVLLREDAQPHSFKESLNSVIKRNRSERISALREYHNLPDDQEVLAGTITALKDIHFEKKVNWTKVSDKQYSTILGGIAVLIVVIASINYISFALTSSITRRKEIGVRKTIGASRLDIFLQFNIDSFGLVLFATMLGVFQSLVLLPLFNELTEKQVTLSTTNPLFLIVFLFALVLTIGLLAGSYPSMIISKLKPALAIKGSKISAKSGIARPLVILQFGISTFLMISSLIMYYQMQFIAAKDLGYNGDNIISIPTSIGWNEGSDKAIQRYRTYTQGNPDIIEVSGSSGSFIGGSMSQSFEYNDREHKVNFIRTDHRYLSLLGIDLLQGAKFYGRWNWR